MLRSLGFTAEELEQRDLMDSRDFGETIRLTSACSAAAEYMGGTDTDAMDYKIRGGNDRLAFELAAPLEPGSLSLGVRIRAIHQNSTGVEAVKN